MVNEYRFFYECNEEKPSYIGSKRLKKIKLYMFSIFSTISLFFYLSGYCSGVVLCFSLLSAFVIIYDKINYKLKICLNFIISILYFFNCIIFSVYANGFVFVSVLIPLSLIYEPRKNDNFIQIKKKVTYCNKHLLLIFEVLVFLILWYADYSFGARFFVLDTISASLFIGLWILKYERYFMYYFVGIFTYAIEFVFWLVLYIEFKNLSALLIGLLWCFYLIYLTVNLCYSVLEVKNVRLMINKL